MGILGGLTKAVLRTACTPIAVVKDVKEAITGELDPFDDEPSNTRQHLRKVGEDLEEVTDGDLL